MSPRLVIAFLTALVLVIFLPSRGQFDPAVLEKSNELREIAKIVLAGLALLWVFNEALEKAFTPVIEKTLDGFGERFGQRFSSGVDRMDTTVKAGFGDLAAAFVSEIGKFPEKFAQQQMSKQLPSTGGATPNDPTKEIAELLKTTDESAWAKARDLLQKYAIKDSHLYLPLALRYWSVGNFGAAISVAESGLAVTAQNDKKLYKNTLAYYYAENEERSKEQLARQYASEARSERNDAPATLDTDGYVRISFASTVTEVKDGLSLCQQAFQQDYAPDMYFRACKKAERKIAELEPEPKA